jgi:hypothetical protein
MISEIHQCCDCLEQFCAACELDAERCPDCGEHLCGECAALALQERKARCTVCADPELSSIGFPYDADSRELYKKYTTPRTGRMSD